MKAKIKKRFISVLSVGCVSTFLVIAFAEDKQISGEVRKKESSSSQDTSVVRYPVKRTVNNLSRISEINPVDLADPSNIKTVVDYDPTTGNYIVRTLMGELEIGTPFRLNQQEYMSETLQQSLRAYYMERTAEEFKKGSPENNLLNIQFNIGKADKIFGPGGVRLKTQGSAELIFGVRNNKVANPSLPERSRNKTYFDFDEKIQLNMNASVGDKVKFNLNYNTDATFDFDAQKIKLQYQGKEDEIIKNIEAGNVSMTTGSSLIKGTQALFGIKTALQFGKLKATAVVAQQESQSKTVNSKGGVQLNPFELSVDQYEENRHFFLSHYFRDNYDKGMSKLPYVASDVQINRIEIWVTNKRGNYDQARNIVAFTDIAESDSIYNTYWAKNIGQKYPNNGSNSLYQTITQPQYNDLRDISLVTRTFDQSPFNFDGGKDFDKIENARLLDASEYYVNKQLGYVSLKSQLQSDEVLAVAFEFTAGGKTYQVGEFSTDITEGNKTLFVKSLKSTAFTPGFPQWHLMMKNVYSLNTYQVQKEKFRMDILYRNDETGINLPYIPDGAIANQQLLKVMGLDRLDVRNEPRPDGFFDYVEGYTIVAQNGKIYFPVVEPFGSHLRKAIKNDQIAKKYVYQELYDSTLTIARQVAEKNKFLLKGEYKSSSGAEIRLGAMNVPRGSVKVMAGGQELRENVDYTVDYSMGAVTLLNQSIIESGTPVSVSLENQSIFSMQRKTLLGLDLSYAFSDNFVLGGTVMHLSEKPLTQKVTMGQESIQNTIWGLNTQYKAELPWLTGLINKVPYINATAPSNLTFNGEFAHLIPGHPKELEQQGVSYLDDFEQTKINSDIRTPYSWTLASVPQVLPTPYYNNQASYPTSYDYYSKNRSLLSWYTIDGIFTRANSSLTPTHIKNDKDQLSNHYVREVLEQELYPNKEIVAGEPASLMTLNLSYYPKERGPYNVDVDGMGTDGYLLSPEKRWAGIMRKMDNPDFEAANIEYIEFWMLDPYIYERQNGNLSENQTGKLYFNLGEISEDILRDGKKFFENGLPVDGDENQVDKTFWGKVPRRQSLVYAFDNTPGARKKQDVGLNGLSTDEEKSFPTYQDYVTALRAKVSSTTAARWDNDKFSPVNDPGGDNFHYFRGSDYDEQQVSILNRYKYYSGTEGNSTASEDSPEKYDVSSRTVPDVEDINQDNTLNEYERYYVYEVPVGVNDLVVGKNFITDRREVTVRLKNGKEETVNWYQFKIPVKSPTDRVGTIRDFKSIRFARMFMTGFDSEVHLRFGALQLVRGEWRQYTQALNSVNSQPSTNVKLDVSAVNIEENATKKPVNYVLPPGVSRVIDPNQPQLRQLNEQALSMKVTHLGAGDAKAVYKNSSIDLRRYKRLQMYVHAEKLDVNDVDVTDLQDNDMTVFLRLGSDYKDNYYEYEIPLKLTPEGSYSNNNSVDREKVWRIENMFDFAFELLTDLKLQRNKEKRVPGSTVSFTSPYSVYDPNKPSNRMTVVGNPTIAEVRTIMIGVRNNSRQTRSAEVWVNELRVSEFNENGGWAAQGTLNLTLSDIATLNLGGRVETAGFGGVEQSVADRRLDDYYQYSVATTVELGRLVPEKVKLKAPIYYSYSEQVSSPQYNPVDTDILLEDALNAAATQAEKDSIKSFSQDIVTNTSFNVNNVKLDIRSKNPMPYDPANFSMSYSFNENLKQNPNLEREMTQDYRGNLSYVYAPMIKPWAPFGWVKPKSLLVIKDIAINYLPNSIAFSTSMQRSYNELRYRDLTSYSGGAVIEPTYNKDFLWNRDFNVRWDLTKQLKLNFTSATNARIDETEGPVDRRFFPNEYESWKDTVMQSIRHLGTPLTYAQSASASYDVPLNKIPALNWMTLGGKFSSNYNWDKGAVIDANTELGNIIKNQNQWNIDGRINLETLYNKSAFLKKTNQRFGASYSRPKQKKSFVQTLALPKDSSITIRHNLNERRPMVIAKNRDNKIVPIEYTVVDAYTIKINSKNAQSVDLTVAPAPMMDDNFAYQAAQYTTRFLMMVRNISVNYRRSNGLVLPSFRPQVGPAFGQGEFLGASAPGWDFAFGLSNDNYIDKALDRNWLIVNDSLTTPATMTASEEFRMTASLEPIRGLKIELNANRLFNDNRQVQFMFAGSPTTRSGNLTMTYVAIGTSLRSSNSEGGFYSEAFNNFMDYRQTIANRVRDQYVGKAYPNSGFVQDLGLGGVQFDPQKGDVSLNSADVLIPAFLAAYGGRRPEKVGLTAFPSLLQLLPNWRITYDGLMQIPVIKRNFKSFNLSHAYRCTYGVNSFSSFSNFVGVEDDLGFIRDILSGNPMPSSPFEIGTVAINESFAPLLGVDVTLKNNLTARAEYKDSRALSLNVTALQIVENNSREWTVGSGYKIANFNTFLRLPSGKQSTFQNDLTLRGDLSYRLSEALIRKIADGFTQATTGTTTFSIKLSADYALSRAVTLRAFYDVQSNKPLISSTSYPVTNTNFGLSVRLSLNQ